jgi:hypothetical protein
VRRDAETAYLRAYLARDIGAMVAAVVELDSLQPIKPQQTITIL